MLCFSHTANSVLKLRSIVVIYCHIGAEMAYPTKASVLPLSENLRPIAKGDKETHEQEDLGIFENHVKNFDCLSTNDRWVPGGVG